MKLKIFSIFLALTTVFLLSCRSTEEQDVIPQEEINQVVEKVEEIPEVEEVEEEPEISLSKVYSVKGTNKRGGRYFGKVYVSKNDDGYQFKMKLRRRTINGQGTLEDNNLIIYWGKDRRFEYEVQENGTIKSRWQKGKELLTPLQ